MPTFFKRGLAVFALVAATVGISIGVGGTRIDGHYRATLTVNPDSIAANGATTSQVTVTGAASGDHCDVAATSGDIMGTTSTAVLTCRVTASNTATVYYRNVSSTAAFDAGTSVLSIQAWSY